jgi:hypothetical protein
MGDLNEYPAADSLDLLYASRYGGGAHGTFLEGGSTRGGRPCRCGTATRSGVKLDYVFVGQASFAPVASWVQDAAYSDHDLLWARVSILG